MPIQYIQNIFRKLIGSASQEDVEQHKTDIAILQDDTRSFYTIAKTIPQLHEEILYHEDRLDTLEDQEVNPNLIDLAKKLDILESAVIGLETEIETGKVEAAYQAAEEVQEALESYQIEQAIKESDNQENVNYLEDYIQEQVFLFNKKRA